MKWIKERINKLRWKNLNNNAQTNIIAETFIIAAFVELGLFTYSLTQGW